MWTFVIPLLVFASQSTALECDGDANEIACSDNSKCISRSYICDDNFDCDDFSDEKTDLCDAWVNADCPVESTLCSRNGDKRCFEIHSYCTSTDPPCEGELDRRICVMFDRGQIQDLSDIDLNNLNSSVPAFNESMQAVNLSESEHLTDVFRNAIPHTISHERCPTTYTLVSDMCVSFFYIVKMSWAEARDFCNAISGDLVVFKNVNQFADIVQHMQVKGLDDNFWIGGSLVNASEGWKWINGSPMAMGTPFWATSYSFSCSRHIEDTQPQQDCYHYYQRPNDPPRGSCASLSFEHSFYVVDEDCLKKGSPLCLSRMGPTAEGHLLD